MKKYLYFTITLLFSFFTLQTVSAKIELSVPFTSQAPYGKWIPPWDNACEEASTLMIDLYYQNYGASTIDKEIATSKINRLIDIENNYLGFNIDNNAEQMAYIINNFLFWEAFVVEDPTLEQLKHEIDIGHPFILPVAGPDLHNPYYDSDNVDYHAFVVKGYDDKTQEFIVQDPGTSHGLDFRYSYDTIMTAMHDFLPKNQTYKGNKVAVFTTPTISDSKNLDGDKDGLNKEQELKYGSTLFFTDSDGDGYSDGNEVANGYSPTKATRTLLDGILVKTPNNPKVYLMENGTKRWIISEKVFLNNGWNWSDIKIVNSSILDKEIISGINISE